MKIGCSIKQINVLDNTFISKSISILFFSQTMTFFGGVFDCVTSTFRQKCPAANFRTTSRREKKSEITTPVRIIT